MRNALLLGSSLAAIIWASSASAQDLSPTQPQSPEPCTWQYSFVNGVATAIYCGNVSLNGNQSFVTQSMLVPTGTPADLTNLQNALGNIAGGGALRLACGFFDLPGANAVTLANKKHISLWGSGNECTVLGYQGANNGLTVTWADVYGSVDVSDMTVTTDQAGVGKGISLIEPFQTSFQVNEFGTNNVDRVSFRGDNQYPASGCSHYWDTAFYEQGLTLLNFVSGSVNNCPSLHLGTGYDLEGGSVPVTGLQSVQISFTGTSVSSAGTAWVYGQNMQGLVLLGVNGTSDKNGVVTTTSTSGPAQLSITDSQFNDDICDVCINDPSMTSVSIKGGQYIVSPTGIGIQLEGLGNSVVGTIVSGLSPPNGSAGVLIASSAPNAGGNIVSENQIGGLTYGIKLAQGVTGYTYAKFNNLESNTFDYYIDYGGSTTQWKPSTSYASGDKVHNNNSGITQGIFRETAATCTSASSGAGPTGTGTGITDGTCTWNYTSQAAGGLFIFDDKASNLSFINAELGCNNSLKYSRFLQADANIAGGWSSVAVGGGSETSPIICNGSEFEYH